MIRQHSRSLDNAAEIMQAKYYSVACSWEPTFSTTDHLHFYVIFQIPIASFFFSPLGNISDDITRSITAVRFQPLGACMHTLSNHLGYGGHAHPVTIPFRVSNTSF